MSSTVPTALIGFIVIVILIAVLVALLFLVIFINKQWKSHMQARILKALSRRNQIDDKFRCEHGYSWDYVIVFKVHDETARLNDTQLTYSMNFILSRLEMGGLETRLFYGILRNVVFCKVRATPTRLKREAARTKLLLPANPATLKALCEKGRANLWKPLDLPMSSPLTTLSPYDHIYFEYKFDVDRNETAADMEGIYRRWPVVSLESIDKNAKADHKVSKRGSEFGLMSNPMSELNSGLEMAEIGHDGVPVAEKGLSDKVREVENIDSSVGHSISHSLFRCVDRLKLINSILKSRDSSGCGMDMTLLLRHKSIETYFPLHDIIELRTLQSSWLNLFDATFDRPYDKVKDYFGEKISLYFLLLETLTSWLCIAGPVGLLTWIYIAVENNDPSAPDVPFFCAFMAIWSTAFIEYWKRKQCRISMEWGMSDIEETEQDRPAFVGKKVLSPVTGKKEVYFSRFTRLFRSFQSSAIIVSFLVLVIGVVALIFFIRVSMNSFYINGYAVGTVISSVLLSIQIQVMNNVYSGLAIRLNDYENHRTDTEYEDALIVKTFLFQVVNSYIALFYTAFAKPFLSIDPCTEGGTGDCMYEMQSMLSTIFISRLFGGAISQVMVPTMQYYYKLREINANVKKSEENYKRFEDTNVHSNFINDASITSNRINDSSNGKSSDQFDISEVERAYVMQEYDSMLGSLDDYSDLVIQFGFMTLFGSAFPLCVLLSLFNNYIEIRVDSWKMCQVVRRPHPKSVEDVGSWISMFELISYLAVFVNAGLVVFTSTNTDAYSWPIRLWIFCTMSLGLLGVKIVIAAIIPDMAEDTEIQLQRMDYLTSKVVDNVTGESRVEDMGVRERPKYTVVDFDDDPM